MSETLLPEYTATPEHEDDTPSRLLLDVVDTLSERRHWMTDVDAAYTGRGRPRGGIRLDVMTIGSGDSGRNVSIHWDRHGTARLALSGDRPRDIEYLPDSDTADRRFRALGIQSGTAVLPLLYAAMSRYTNLPGGAALVGRAEALGLYTEGTWRGVDGTRHTAQFIPHRGQVLRIDTLRSGTPEGSGDVIRVRSALDRPEARQLSYDGISTGRLIRARDEQGRDLLYAQNGMRAEVGLSSATRAELVSYALESFIGSRGFDMLAELHGYQLPQDYRGRLSVLQKLAAEQWDFRAGQERQAVDWGSGLDPQVEKAARLIGQVESTRPVNTRPKVGLVLGAANKAPYDRLRYLRGEAAVDPDIVAYAGSSRPVSADERTRAQSYALHPNDEFDLGCGALQTVMDAHMIRGGALQHSGEDTRAWREFSYADPVTGVSRSAFALSTPFELTDGAKKRRATTYDNLEAVATDQRLDLQPGDSVVQATTQLYAPAQHIVALEVLTLGHGIYVETVGHDAAFSGVTRTTKQYLQEARSAIDAAVHLQATLDARQAT